MPHYVLYRVNISNKYFEDLHLKPLNSNQTKPNLKNYQQLHRLASELARVIMKSEDSSMLNMPVQAASSQATC